MRARNVSKQFKIYRHPETGPALDMLTLGRCRDLYSLYRAVNDVSLEIKKGEVVGIIGANGAGKSTLLRMIAGLVSVDSGLIEINGKVTTVLTMGLGIHPEFTGRDNILYSGILTGMTKEEIIRKTPDIVEFCELGEYIDQPIRTYSTGMLARLAFSIAMSVEPEILVVDEALATGDKYFIDKCIERMRGICRSGATILFVSHNLAQINELCERTIIMKHGRIHFNGDPAEAMQRYPSLVHG